MTRLMISLAMVVSMTALADAKSVAGSWKSAGAEDMGNGSFSTRRFVLTDTTWTLVFTIYGDKELKVPLVAMDFEGPWKVGGPSAAVAGAREATFEFKTKKITLKAKDVAKNFGMDGCGLEVGKSKDVSKTGCSFVGSVAAYPREFDLVKRDGEQLFLGARPADGNMGTEDKRPTALGQPLVRGK